MNQKTNQLFSTFLLILIAIGYQVATSLLLPLSSNVELASRSVTVPYRAFALLVTLIVIFLNIKRPVVLSTSIKALFFYWFILIIRVFYDFYVRTDVHILSSHKILTWSYIFPIILFSTYAILKSYPYINLRKALNIILWATGITLFITYFSVQEFKESATERLQTNVGLGTISTGHFALTGILLSLFVVLEKIKIRYKYVIIPLNLIFGFLFFLKSGSRGPILVFAVIITIWTFAKVKKNFSYAIGFSTIFVLIYLIRDKLFALIYNIAPIIIARFQREDQLDSRNALFDEAIESFINSPFLGEQFAIFLESGKTIYSHNIILDGFMGMGIVGGLLIIYIIFISIKYSYQLIVLSDKHYWIGFILLQYTIMNMTSGAFYENVVLSPFFVLLDKRINYLNNK